MCEERYVECDFCGKMFVPWVDGDGELNEDACKSCDASYEEGMINDRDLGCSG